MCGVRGLGFKIKISCGKCPDKMVNSSPYIDKAFEVNRRTVFAMRAIGIGYSGLKLFCGLMDLFPPVAKSFCSSLNDLIRNAVQSTADIVMNKAALEELKETREKKIFEDENGIAASGDGSWMKRGFTSLYGIVAMIGHESGKVIDVIIKSAYCKVCELMEKKVGTAEYDDYINEHWPDCKANHDGSSGMMEGTGTVQLFQRSVETRGLKYLYFIGDGDSKTFKQVADAKPYGDDCIIKKKECVGHVGKRMGRRLRELKKKNKGLGGKGKLTGKEIDKLSSYYGKAIRDHSDSVEGMQNAVWATFYHRASTKTKPQHHLCPTGPASWCDWQKAKSTGEKYVYKPGLPADVIDAIKPIYEDLTNADLLERCMGAYTQNSNESFNQLVWKIAPKSKPGSSVIVETATYMSAMIFNEGYNSVMNAMQAMGITLGQHCEAECEQRDAQRVAIAEERIKKSTKEFRIELRRARLKAQDEWEQEEGQFYGAGIAD